MELDTSGYHCWACGHVQEETIPFAAPCPKCGASEEQNWEKFKEAIKK